MGKRWYKEESGKLESLYFKQKLPIEQIARVLRRTTASINQRLSLKYRRNRSLPKVIIPTKINPALARIHAHISGDGNLFNGIPGVRVNCFSAVLSSTKFFLPKFNLWYNVTDGKSCSL